MVDVVQTLMGALDAPGSPAMGGFNPRGGMPPQVAPMAPVQPQDTSVAAVLRNLLANLTSRPTTPHPVSPGLESQGVQGPQGSPMGPSARSNAYAPHALLRQLAAGIANRSSGNPAAAATLPAAPEGSGPAAVASPGLQSQGMQGGAGSPSGPSLPSRASSGAAPGTPVAALSEILPWSQQPAQGLRPAITAAPVPPPSSAPAPTSRLGGQPPQSGVGVTPKDVQSFFRALAAGAAGDPNRSPLGAFFTGASRALETKEAIGEGDKKAALEAEDRSFERGVKTAAERRAEAKDKREARAAEITNAKTVTDIMKTIRPDGSVPERTAIEQALAHYAQAVNKDGSMTPEELRTALEERRNWVLHGSTSAAPTTPPAAAGSEAPGQPPATAPQGAQEGQTAINRQTGQRIIFRNGQWQPL
jgi:hypothetical protein